MKTSLILKLIPITFVAAGLFLGCGDEHDHDHDGDGKPDHGPGEGHDHDGDGDKKDAAAVADDYPMTTCLVEDSKLDSMGEPFVHVHEGITVKFCCEGCLKDFNKDPKKYLAKLEAAKKAKPAERTAPKAGKDLGETSPGKEG
ncbi:MAG: hypothetical protein OSB29_00225 [Verrucomicrobiota bacterium]|nr:hypothetical protein [Verrucomicrobiota bacterium]